MLLDTAAVRDNLRNRDGKRVFYLRTGDQLSSDARDWLRAQRVEILPGREARPDRFRLASGGYADEKPEHMTHLHGDVLVKKTHPVIRFRGMLDRFQALAVLTQGLCPETEKPLGEILDLSNRILRADVLETPLEEGKLLGMDEQALHRASHFPQEKFGIPHFMPDSSQGLTLALLNLLRAEIRQAELTAVEAFSDREGNPTREDLLRALNRMSSGLYILMIMKKAGKL